MALDTRWKNPPGAEVRQLYRWAQDLITELRKGPLDDSIGSDQITDGSIATADLADDAVTNAKLANMAQSTIKGRAVGAGTGDPTDLTATQATAILDVFTNALQGLVPASGGGTANFLRADGAFAAPPSATAATQAEEEAASSTTVFTTPGRQKFHPGVAKAWVKFNGTGTLAVNASHNVSSVTDNGTGDYTVNFTTAFSSADYAYSWGIKPNSNTDTDMAVVINSTGGMAAGSFRMIINNESTGAAVDRDIITVVFFGDQ